MNIIKQHFRAVVVPKDEVSDTWFSDQVKLYFEEQLSEFYDLPDKIKLEDTEVDRYSEKLTSDTNLSLLVGFNEKKNKVQAQFLKNCLRAASVEATVV
ncbi:MAG: hypothetical protein WD335_01560 [Candidatus Paceibacterota bacterium]